MSSPPSDPQSPYDPPQTKPTSQKPYLEAPVPTTKMPGGIPFIVANEAAERFSFYGMKAILMIFMTEHLMSAAGMPDNMTEERASMWIHLFTASAYFFPFLGALLADIFWGKYRTILTLSLFYCVGHAVLAIDGPSFGLSTRTVLGIGLALIAIGSGGIKSCVSAHVGDQFGKTNSHLIEKVFGWFYLSINLGAFTSMMLTPWLMAEHGPHWAFGVPGILMGIATFLFWLGRNRFIHVPPGGKKFFKETFSKEGLQAVAKLSLIYLFVIIFWSVFDQSGSRWVGQAKRMDLFFLGKEWLPSQIQALNPILILTLIPLYNYLLFPLVDRYLFKLTPLRKISIGLIITILAAAFPWWIEMQILGDKQPSIGWQALAYFILTSAEVLVSVTVLEFSYTQAPRNMKSLLMGVMLLSISLGNILAAQINYLCDTNKNFLPGEQYYGFFVIIAAVNAVIFMLVARFYKPKTYLQEELPEVPKEV